MSDNYPRVARLNSAEKFRTHIASLGVHLPFDETVQTAPDSPLAQPFTLKTGRMIGNRFAIHPMEGWDGTAEGLSTENTMRRWTNFGKSGAKLIWGGEAVAVRHDGRANPNQLRIGADTLAGLADLRQGLVNTHREHHGQTDDLVVGLQLTHSGRFCRPNVKTRLEPMILYHHPVLDPLFNLDPGLPVLTDGEIDDLIGDFVRAAGQAASIGFDFVDIKHCHGYLGHEFLSAYERPGRYGGSFENRTRFVREIVAGIRREAPGLMIGVRLSAFDFPPFRPGPDGAGVPKWWDDEDGRYPFGFGGDKTDPLAINLTETAEFLRLLESLDIQLVNLSCCSPYYNPHFMRPATFPPSDGYLPPEDPLVGVARQINAVAALKAEFPNLALVGTGYTYLQDWLPNVAQHVVGHGMVDFVGLGRMVLSYPEFPADMLTGREMARKRICRTFSDCTTAPRNGMVSGCYPLDDFYKDSPEAIRLKEIKAG
ncbi:MAG: NADH:flavin oxidoreductase [Caldilineales bacterium]|nr:NADH:flavin oxidoreductase [Caldilineales bacterium]